MKPNMKKTLPTAVILTAAFSFMLFGGPTDGPARQIVGAIVMATAVFASALIWAKGTDDDHHKEK